MTGRDDRVALVTGAARGQGRSHACGLAADGVDIVAVDGPRPVPWLDYPLGTLEQLEETAELVRAAGRRCLTAQADVTDAAALAVAVEAALTTYGHIDVVVANAAIAPRAHRFWEIPEDEWQTVLDIDLTGVWRTVSAAVPAMIEAGRGGSIVVISSAAALAGASNIGGYSAAKAGVIGLMRTMARELAPYEICVNAICPTNVDTQMLQHDATYRLFRPDLEHPTREDMTKPMSRYHLLRHPWVDPDDITAAVRYLTSPGARRVTAQVLAVDMGASL